MDSLNSTIEEIELESKENTQMCPICYWNKPNNTIIPYCGHSFCTDCMKLYLMHSISESKVRNLKCPVCANPLGRKYLSEILDKSWIQKYDRFLLREELVLNPFVRFCPKGGCNGYDTGSSNKRKLKCNECGYLYCFFCLDSWHGWRRCHKNDDVQFEEWVRANNVKFCPKCKRMVEKRGGCSHMNCICGTTWCWICGSSKLDPNHNFYCLLGKDIWNVNWFIILCLILGPLLFPFSPFLALVIAKDYINELESELWIFEYKKYFYPLLFLLSPVILIVLMLITTGNYLLKWFRILELNPILVGVLLACIIPVILLIDAILILFIALVLYIAVITGIALFFVKIYGRFTGKTIEEENFYPKVFI